MKHPHILRLLFALSFLFSAYTKFVGLGYFEITLMDQGIASSRELAAHLTRFFIGLEFALGVLLFFPYYTKKVVLFSIGLLGVFSLHLAYLFFLGDNENCGCFGEMISMNPAQSLQKTQPYFRWRFGYISKRKKKHSQNPSI